MNTCTSCAGDTGRRNNMDSNNGYDGYGCETQSDIDDIYDAQLFKYANLRLATSDELKPIINYYCVGYMLIELDFLPNGQNHLYHLFFLTGALSLSYSAKTFSSFSELAMFKFSTSFF